ncbi:MAG: ABC transporter permease subunit [Dehalococcoidia bacterium]|nr:ABC transporter permease subunit [Dehalococcoidia bacterium]
MNLHWRRMGLVAWREIRERVRTRTFLLSTAVVALLAAGGVAGTGFIEDAFEPGPERLGVLDASPETLTSTLEETAEAFGVTLDLRRYESEGIAEAALQDDQVDALLLDGERLVFRDSESRESHEELAMVANQAVRLLRLPQQLEQLGLTPEQGRSLLQPEPLPQALLDQAEPVAEDNEASGALASFSVIVLFMAVAFYGNSILMGVVEEKTTRVVEVLLGSLRPRELLTGKVLGILAVGMMQFGAGVVAAVAAVAVTGTADMPAVAGETAVWLGVWLLLGLLLYSFMYAAAGALVSRQEEAGNVTTPIMTVLLGAYFATLFVALNDPDGTEALVMSLVPFTAPLVMPPMMALGDPPVWQIAASLVMTVLGIAAVIWFSGRLYAGAVLRTGPRVRLLEAWRSARGAP